MPHFMIQTIKCMEAISIFLHFETILWTRAEFISRRRKTYGRSIVLCKQWKQWKDCSDVAICVKSRFIYSNAWPIQINRVSGTCAAAFVTFVLRRLSWAIKQVNVPFFQSKSIYLKQVVSLPRFIVNDLFSAEFNLLSTSWFVFRE